MCSFCYLFIIYIGEFYFLCVYDTIYLNPVSFEICFQFILFSFEWCIQFYSHVFTIIFIFITHNCHTSFSFYSQINYLLNYILKSLLFVFHPLNLISSIVLKIIFARANALAHNNQRKYTNDVHWLIVILLFLDFSFLFLMCCLRFQLLHNDWYLIFLYFDKKKKK